MSRIGVDLLVASIVERMARQVPKTSKVSVYMRRAKAQVEASPSDARLNATISVSLPHLQ